MRPKENMEKFVRVRKANVKTSRQMDKRTLDDSFAAMEQTIRAKPADHKPSAPRIITLSRMIKLAAAAAVIIVGISFYIARQGPSEQGDTTRILEVIESPSEMLTMKSLTIAYRQGGMEAVEKQYEKASEMRRAKPTEISFQELLSEFNGT